MPDKPTPRDWLTNPLWQPDSIGQPIPDDPHAVSVSLPNWHHVIGYEEGDPAVVSKMLLGYPRFVLHPNVKRLFHYASTECALPHETATVWPSRPSADRAAHFVQKHGGPVRIQKLPHLGLHALLYPADQQRHALYYWRISGEVVSSRLAAQFFNSANHVTADGQAARTTIRQHLSLWTGQPAELIHLFPSGMAAIFFAQQALQLLRPGTPCTQVEFPYVDALRVQREFSVGNQFISASEIEKISASSAAGGVFAEIPSNPLLRSPDFEKLHRQCLAHNTPLLLDDTVATVLNVNAFRFADLVTTSLTKWLCGTGNVLAGCLTINANSPWAQPVTDALRILNPPELSDADAIALAPRLADFPDRLRQINTHTQALVAYLQRCPAIRDLWHPLVVTKNEYDQVRRTDGGYGGLLSFTLKGCEPAAARFYDNWRIAKGPSLGTDFSIACPFTLLAHYDELDWAANYGVPRDLIRLSVGLEDSDDMIRRFEAALSHV